MDRSTVRLFEFSGLENKLDDRGQRCRLENFLREIWLQRYTAYAEDPKEDEQYADEEQQQSRQPFLRFDGEYYRSQNFVGFIQFENQIIEIYPKVFRDKKCSDTAALQHLFFWFSYCRKLHFPILQNKLDRLESAVVPELLIWNFACYTEQLLAEQPYSRYEWQEEAVAAPRGRIDISAYLRNNFSKGNQHKVDCRFESFEFNNLLNKGIKYVCRLLLQAAKVPATHQKLQEILFLLDDVEDEPITIDALETVTLNPVFEAYLPVKEWCIRVLEQQLYSSGSYDSFQWSLLLPMEYVFEDFVYGFLEAHLSNEYDIHPQKSNYYLTRENVFRLKHDIYLEHIPTQAKIIIDTKYKLRDADTDSKKGIAQSDMYQMLSYAYRRGCTTVILLYPNRHRQLQEDVCFTVATDFEDMPEIKIKACEIPFGDGEDTFGYQQVLENRLRAILK